MNSPQANASTSSSVHREWLTLFAIVMGLAVITLIALVIGVTGYFRLGGDTAALRRVVAETTGQRLSRKVELNIGSWTTSLAQLGTGFIHMDARAREVLNGVRSAEAGVYHLMEPLDSRKTASLMASTDLVMTGRGWDRVVGVRNRDATVIAYVPRETMSPDDVKVCFIVVHGRDVVVGQGRASLEPLISLWRMEQDRPHGLGHVLARSR